VGDQDEPLAARHHYQGNENTIARIKMNHASTIHHVELNPMKSVRRRGSGRTWYQRRPRSSVASMSSSLRVEDEQKRISFQTTEGIDLVTARSLIVSSARRTRDDPGLPPSLYCFSAIRNSGASG
jgi:hypothetical protein